MTRRLFTLAAAIGVVGACGTTASADEQVIPLGRYQPATQGFGGGVTTPGTVPGTLPGAVTPEGVATDTEQVHWHRHHAWGWGYRPYTSFGFYRPHFGYYAPGFAFSYYSAPRFVAPPVYFYPSYSYSWYYPGFCGISLKEKLDVAANVVDLALRAKAVVDANRQPEPAAYPFPQPQPQPVPQWAPGTSPQPLPPSAAPHPQPGNSFRYDGGPARPVPMPTPDAKPTPQTPTAPPAATEQPGTVQISYPAPAAPTKYRYRAYGEK